MTGRLLLSYYGDDFTGSTDVLESLTMNGLPTVLFLEAPTPQRLEKFPWARAVGVAGVSRSQSPAWMDENLPETFSALKALGAHLCHYKVCSTFDSAPEIGSIGRALEIGVRTFGSTPVPVVVGAPALGRYQAFANLFAKAGGTIHRIDRHPTMSVHPVTPMEDADLREHLGKQTDCATGLMDITSLWADDYHVRHRDLAASSPDVVLYDVMDERSLQRVGELVWQSTETGPRFAVGSSGLEYALVDYWRCSGAVDLDAAPEQSGTPVDRLFVISGSCSPVTAEQIRWARDNGFEECPLDPLRLTDADQREQAIDEAVDVCTRSLNAGRSVIAFSALGAPGADARARAQRDPSGFSRSLGEAQGRILRETTLRSGVRRVVVAGGDTSGNAAQQLGLYALTAVAPIAPGAPLCRAHSDDSRFDGVEIVLKGGQVGDARFFERVQAGHAGIRETSTRNKA